MNRKTFDKKGQKISPPLFLCEQVLSSTSRIMPRKEKVSFQTLPIKDDKGADKSAPATSTEDFGSNDAAKLSKAREERRQRTSSMAGNQHIRDMIAKTVEELSSGEGQVVGSWEERLKRVLSDAKESGHSADRIFAILGCNKTKSQENGGGGGGELIQKSLFVDGLTKLGLKWKDEAELKLITDRFHSEGNDEQISSSKIQKYCYYEVPSVAWKAERNRLEQANAAVEDGLISNSIRATRFDGIKDIVYRVGPEVYSTSKLFWRQNVSVNIKLRYSKDLDIITMQLQNTETGEDFETLYIRKSDCIVDKEAVEDAADDDVRWKAYADFLVTRLVMTKIEGGSSFQPRLGAKLEMEKPSNLLAPKRAERQSGMDVKSIEAEFQDAMKSFDYNSTMSRKSRQSAHELSSFASSALAEILDDAKNIQMKK
jgi:hypothetical protein